MKTNKQEYDPLEEIHLVIKSWKKELKLEKTWDDDLHPADILDKHIFPQLTQTRKDVIEEIRRKTNKLITFRIFEDRGADTPFVTKKDVLSILKHLEKNE